MLRYLFVVFGTVFLAELGDKTQLAILLYSTKPDVSRVGIALAASLALVTTTVVAVIIGDRLARWVNPKFLEGAAAIGFVLIGVFMLISLFKAE